MLQWSVRLILIALAAVVSHAYAAASDPIQLATKDQPFQLAADTLVYYCADVAEASKAIAGTAGAKCNPPKLVRAGTTVCNYDTFGPVNGVLTDPAPGIDKPCYRSPGATPAPFTSCYPDIDVKVTWTGWSSANYHYGDVPPSVGAKKPYIGWWKDACTKKYTAQYFDGDDIMRLGAALTKKLLGSSDAINAWVASQPMEMPSAAEQDYKVRFLEVLNGPPPPTVPVCNVRHAAGVVAGSAADVRPVYPKNADGTRSTKAVSGVFVKGGALADCNKRIGDYFSVQGHWDTMNRVMGDVYAYGLMQ